jgi:hypothetical protein
MTLEPIIPLDEEDNHELKDFQRRFWWTLPLDRHGHRSCDVRPPPRLV